MVLGADGVIEPIEKLPVHATREAQLTWEQLKHADLMTKLNYWYDLILNCELPLDKARALVSLGSLTQMMVKFINSFFGSANRKICASLSKKRLNENKEIKSH